MHTSIPVDLQQFVQQEVACGKFRTTDEVVAEGLRLLQEREHKRALLRKELQIAVDELDRGEGILISSEEEHRIHIEELLRAHKDSSKKKNSST